MSAHNVDRTGPAGVAGRCYREMGACCAASECGGCCKSGRKQKGLSNIGAVDVGQSSFKGKRNG